MAKRIEQVPLDELKAHINAATSYSGAIKLIGDISANGYNIEKLKKIIHNNQFDTSHFVTPKNQNLSSEKNAAKSAAMSKTLKEQYASGERSPAKGVGRGKGGYVDGIWYRSSYELIVAIYLNKAGIKFEYESIRVPFYKQDGTKGIKVSDFSINGEVYEVYGWQDKTEVVKAFEASGYTIHLFGPNELEVLKSFLSDKDLFAYSLTRDGQDTDECLCGKTKRKKSRICKDCHHGKSGFNIHNDLKFTENRNCKVCKEPFSTQNSKREHCSEVCRIKRYFLECSFCKEDFFANRSDQKHCSYDCSAKSQYKVEKPTREELQKLVWEIPTQQLEKRFGVSEASIRNWCKQMEIKKPPRGYWAKQQAQEIWATPPVSKQEMKRLVEQDALSVNDLAKKFKTEKPKVSHWLAMFSLRTKDHIRLGIKPQTQNKCP